jgi:hypothetical protein
MSLKISSFLQLSIQLILLPLFSTCASYHLKCCTLKMMMYWKLKYSTAIHIHVDKWPMTLCGFFLNKAPITNPQHFCVERELLILLIK